MLTKKLFLSLVVLPCVGAIVAWGWTTKASAQSLHEAAKQNNVPAIREAIRKGEPINAKDKRGFTSLAITAQAGYVEAVQVLVENGADMESRGPTGNTPLLDAHSVNPEDDRIGYSSDHMKIVRFLLKKGANINATNDSGFSILTQAAAAGDVELVRDLLDAGAKIEVKDKHGNTPLIRAAAMGYAETVALLLEKGADPNGTNNDGQTALMYAAAFSDGNRFTLEDMVKNRAIKRRRDHLEVARVLIDKGANVTVKSKGGSTALSASKDPDMQVLLQKATQSGR